MAVNNSHLLRAIPACRQWAVVLLCWIAVISIIQLHGTYWNSDFNYLSLDASTLPPISRKIWQVTSDERAAMFRKFNQTTIWQLQNAGYEYSLYGDTKAIEFAQEHYGETVAQLLSSLKNPGVRADLIRYLLLGAEGGVYSDTDTTPVKPIDQWAPKKYRDRVKLIVGIEWDERDDDPADRSPDLFYELQFCQWTIAAAPQHPVFNAMLERAITKIDELRLQRGVASTSEVVFENTDVLNSTGPAAWTDIVFSYLRVVDPTIQSLKEFSMLREPRIVGDVLILPIDGFASGVPHSGATVGSISDMAMVTHQFEGSWRNG